MIKYHFNNKYQEIFVMLMLSFTGLNALTIFNTIPLSIQKTFIFDVIDLTLIFLAISFLIAGSIEQYLKNRRRINR
ncbi:hypothetical protein ACLIKE_04145 [Ferroplasma acidiphilum]|jgi:hypothetical protein|uniref:Uncharacterized protein n=2 Tax=Ferroplasma TaxID=74968 RepID=S0APE7_FERAC|nr:MULTISPECIES: hypothetical protein [Ferroplasma]AGO60637.1 hypothetical protein FACI_IFERC00001G0657 [Ferroplasma acidarmanus Fer1]ARD85396.1 hypothetical protein FAD_1547 [Ferroplasma acidiphilum]